MTKILKYLGICVVLFSLLFIIVGLATLNDKGSIPAIIFFFFCLSFGISLIRKANKMKMRKMLLNLVKQGHEEIDEICKILNRSDIDKVRNEIQSLITEGKLPGYSVDLQRRIVSRILPGKPKPEYEDSHVIGDKLTLVNFTCKGCGANNGVHVTVGQSAAKCEYCETSNEFKLSTQEIETSDQTPTILTDRVS